MAASRRFRSRPTMTATSTASRAAIASVPSRTAGSGPRSDWTASWRAVTRMTAPSGADRVGPSGGQRPVAGDRVRRPDPWRQGRRRRRIAGHGHGPVRADDGDIEAGQAKDLQGEVTIQAVGEDEPVDLGRHGTGRRIADRGHRDLGQTASQGDDPGDPVGRRLDRREAFRILVVPGRQRAPVDDGGRQVGHPRALDEREDVVPDRRGLTTCNELGRHRPVAIRRGGLGQHLLAPGEHGVDRRQGVADAVLAHARQGRFDPTGREQPERDQRQDGHGRHGDGQASTERDRGAPPAGRGHGVMSGARSARVGPGGSRFRGRSPGRPDGRDRPRSSGAGAAR